MLKLSTPQQRDETCHSVPDRRVVIDVSSRTAGLSPDRPLSCNGIGFHRLRYNASTSTNRPDQTKSIPGAVAKSLQEGTQACIISDAYVAIVITSIVSNVARIKCYQVCPTTFYKNRKDAIQKPDADLFKITEIKR